MPPVCARPLEPIAARRVRPFHDRGRPIANRPQIDNLPHPPYKLLKLNPPSTFSTCPVE
jgi:hypothetical protein